MFDYLSDKFQNAVSSILGKRSLNEDNIKKAVSEVRLALLDADVNYSVIKTFVTRVKEKALGDEVLKSVEAGQQFIKIVHDELAALMGGEAKDVVIKKKPTHIMVCGLQGSGKTTFCAKLARYLKHEKKAEKVLLVACDRQRPAAVEQLKQLSEKVGCDIFTDDGQEKAEKVAKHALKVLKEKHYDVVIFDTAGRLHIDQELMKELKSIKGLIKPDEVLFVANAMLGQDAVNVAKQFHEDIEFDGTVLTMLDGSTRGGAALSIVEITKKPLKFEGIGERIEDVQLFHPQSMADRILGMGDTINLVRKAQEHISEKDAKDLEQKLKKATFTYDDFLKQFAMVKKMGSFKGILKMIPGVGGALKDLPIDEKEFEKNEAIILSMTKDERFEKSEMIMPRRRRIAKGSGTSLDDVNKLVKNFKNCKKFMKNMPKGKALEKLMGGFHGS
ncbi:MAG: Signal recognition particle protein [Chlamydiae bacterium]|nr:Signal recognition particle protein [Chlamydiota bacterium]